MFSRFVLTAAATLATFALAGCAGTPKDSSEDATIFVNPETGQVYVDPNASDEMKVIAALLNQEMAKPETAPAPELSDGEIWRTDAAGNHTHIQSGLLCPSAWSDFMRDTATIFDRSGQDVGCNYTDTSGGVITFYAYRSDLEINAEFDDIMRNIVMARNPIHRPANISSLKVGQIGELSVSGAIAFETGQGVDMVSGVALSDMAGWRLKTRFTFPTSNEGLSDRFLGVSILAQMDAIGRAAAMPIESKTANDI